MTTPLVWSDLNRYFKNTWVRFVLPDGKTMVGKVHELGQTDDNLGMISLSDGKRIVHTEAALSEAALNERIKMLTPCGYVNYFNPSFTDVMVTSFVCRAPVKTSVRGLTYDCLQVTEGMLREIVRNTGDGIAICLNYLEEGKYPGFAAAVDEVAEGKATGAAFERRWAIKTLPQGAVVLEYMGMHVGYINKNRIPVLAQSANEMVEAFHRQVGFYPEIARHA